MVRLQDNTWSEPSAKHPHHHRRGDEQWRRGFPPHKAALLIKGRSLLAPEPADETPESQERQGTGQKHDGRFQWQCSPDDSRRRCPQAAGNICSVELGRAQVELESCRKRRCSVQIRMGRWRMRVMWQTSEWLERGALGECESQKMRHETRKVSFNIAKGWVKWCKPIHCEAWHRHRWWKGLTLCQSSIQVH